jgi:hypothetical protein
MSPAEPSPDLATRSRVLTLLAEYRAQQKGLQQQLEVLARLELDVLNAADREADEILMRARTEIRATMLKARGQLLTLAAHVEAMTGRPFRTTLPDGSVFEPARETFLATRQHMRDVLGEARSDLDRLGAEAVARGFRVRGPGLPDVMASALLSTQSTPSRPQEVADVKPRQADRRAVTKTRELLKAAQASFILCRSRYPAGRPAYDVVRHRGSVSYARSPL